MARTKRVTTKGFFVLRDVSTGKYLAGRHLTASALVEFGEKVAVYRTDTSAAKSARTAIENYQRLAAHWNQPEQAEEMRVQYGRQLQGVEVVQLLVTPGPTQELVH